jgi:hypothetical protein
MVRHRRYMWYNGTPLARHVPRGITSIFQSSFQAALSVSQGPRQIEVMPQFHLAGDRILPFHQHRSAGGKSQAVIKHPQPLLHKTRMGGGGGRGTTAAHVATFRYPYTPGGARAPPAGPPPRQASGRRLPLEVPYLAQSRIQTPLKPATTRRTRSSQDVPEKFTGSGVLGRFMGTFWEDLGKIL